MWDLRIASVGLVTTGVIMTSNDTGADPDFFSHTLLTVFPSTTEKLSLASSTVITAMKVDHICVE